MVACDVCNSEKNVQKRTTLYCVLDRGIRYFPCMWHVHGNEFVSTGIRELNEIHEEVQKRVSFESNH